MPISFMDACLNGNAVSEDIDCWVQKWQATETGLELYEYLGFTEPEYDVWLVDANQLDAIITERKKAK